MSNFKGFFKYLKKGSYNSGSPILPENVWISHRPFIEKDPTVPQHVKTITAQELSNWTEGFNKNIISGSITGDKNKTVTLTRRTGETLSFSFADNEGVDTDDVLNTIDFDEATGVFTAITSEGVQITANMDGRYALLNHTHDFDKYESWRIQVDANAANDITTNALLKLISGNNISLSVNGSDITITANLLEGTKPVSVSRALNASDNGKTLLITGENIVLTVPTGLGKNFTCNFLLLSPDTGVCQIVAGAGFTLNAPLGDKLLVHYTANLIKTTDAESGNLRGELTP